MIVGISQRVDYLPLRNERRDSLDQKMVDFVIASNCVPVPIPNNIIGNTNRQQKAYHLINEWISNLGITAIILSGGNDVGSNLERDITERCLIRHSKEFKRPTLGLCRGMQLLAIEAGAKLKQVNGHTRSRHFIYGEIQGEVNSYHKYSITACPKNYTILARTKDREIEAIKHKHFPIEAWMWHPEREDPLNMRDLERFRNLIR
jgi:gamma-glutamyl-gamma-aminobutyrate hydrolase PuuD